MGRTACTNRDQGDLVEAWANFCVAQIGASAALAGLVFVGASINLAKIIVYPRLVGLILEAILMLAIVLGESTILLAPGPSPAWTGGEIVAFSAALWVGVGVVQRRLFHNTSPDYRRHYWRFVIPNHLAMLAFSVAGIGLLAGSAAALPLFLPANLICYAVALRYAWVLLIEINR